VVPDRLLHSLEFRPSGDSEIENSCLIGSCTEHAPGILLVLHEECRHTHIEKERHQGPLKVGENLICDGDAFGGVPLLCRSCLTHWLRHKKHPAPVVPHVIV